MLELPQYIDSTMVSTFRSCHRKFYWSFIRNKVLDGSNVHLTAGGALAASLDLARRIQFGNPPIPVPDLMAAIIPTFLSHWGKLEVESGHAKNIHNVIWALEEYLSTYHPATDIIQPLQRDDGTPTTEFTFAIPLKVKHPSGDPFVYCGRFDELGRYTSNDLPVVMDEKTTGALSTAWQRQWDLRGQFLGYVWACQQLGYRLRDVVVRGIGIYKTGPQFLSVPISYPQHLIDRWHLQLLQTVNTIKLCYEADHWAYDFADACSSYGGCPYTTLCQSKDPEPWLTNYTDRTWSPIQHTESVA